MKILILHPNFPGQYVNFANYLLGLGHEVAAMMFYDEHIPMPGVRIYKYKRLREPSSLTHPYSRTLEGAVLDGQAVVRMLRELRYRGYVPDIIIGHTGWGSTLFVKDLYPNVPVIGLFEWFYRALGSDMSYYSGEEVGLDDKLRIRIKNAHHLINLDVCDAGYCATEWQRSQFPAEYQTKLRVIHDGIDTNFCSPQADTRLVLDDIKLDLSACPEIITYVSRGFEAYRGFPQFMDALRIVLRQRPQAQAVLVGADRVCYGAELGDGDSYQKRELAKGGLDMNRVHFVGIRARGDYQRILRASNVHVYLTRPFVLSWSMMEAMSFACPMVCSATPPVEEVMTDGVDGLLADLRSPEEIAACMNRLLDNRELAARLGRNARQRMVDNYSLDRLLPKLYDLMMSQVKR